uniref:Ig-like domain-containing protein n=1 Tax=Zosterops lateralis melanops TaxID=1220523 RepID=A0A8D2QML8_ZOSLA
WLLGTFFLATFLSLGFAQDFQQTPISITKPEGETVLINCHVSSPDFSNVFIHWYQQRVNAAPKRIAYMSSRFFLENGLKIDYTANLIFFKEYLLPVQTQLSHTDIVKALFTVIGYYNKVFGSGTKLVVSGKFSPPANSEILQKKHENQITYVCLIEKFYPDIIRVTWNDDEKEITDQVVKGDTWQSTKEDDYSIASWLTVPAENEDKKYYCKYEHEEKKDSLSTQGIFHMLKI